MTILEIDNRTDLTTATRTFDLSHADQSPPNTRRVDQDAYASDIETLEIERNEEFYGIILERLGRDSAELVDSSDITEY